MKNTSAKRIRGFIPDSEYYICVKNLPTAAVDVVIFSKEKDKVLLFKRLNEPAKGEYFTPGGKINKGERMKDAAIRKLKEETGLEVKPNELIFGGLTEEFYPNSVFGDLDSHYIDIIYGIVLSTAIEKDIKLDAQHCKHQWFDLGDPHIPLLVKNKINTISDKL